MRRCAVPILLAFVSFAASAGCSRGTRASNAAAPPAAGAPQAAAAAQAPADSNAVTGTVAETMNSGGYTYARLQSPGKDDVWIAAREFTTKAGEQLSAAVDTRMDNFESKTLHRTFPAVYFVSSVSRDGQRVDGPAGAAGAEGGRPALMSSHGSAPVQASVEPVAPPAGGLSIAEVWTKRNALAGREVTVRGKVVKVNSGIMGRNWIHLQDGSGSANDGTNDLTITSDEEARLGDVVTFKGVLAVDKDFTAGYKYGVIVETAKLIK